jgi:hypothetical protein
MYKQQHLVMLAIEQRVGYLQPLVIPQYYLAVAPHVITDQPRRAKMQDIYLQLHLVIIAIEEREVLAMPI